MSLKKDKGQSTKKHSVRGESTWKETIRTKSILLIVGTDTNDKKRMKTLKECGN